jgi:hypothetical protein
LAATLASLLPVAMLAFASHSLPDFAARDLLTAIVAPAAMLPAYFLALRRLAPDTWNDCLQIYGVLLAGVARRRR